MDVPELGDPKVWYMNRYDKPGSGIVNHITAKLSRHRRDDEPSTTSIPLSAISGFEDERIRNALWDQWRGELENSSRVIIPVVIAHEALSHVVSVRRRPLELDTDHHSSGA